MEKKTNKLPKELTNLVEQGTLRQWRKYPSYFFVAGVEKGRIKYDSQRGIVVAYYTSEIPTEEQRAKFYEVFHPLCEVFNTEYNAKRAEKRAKEEAKKKEIAERYKDLKWELVKTKSLYYDGEKLVKFTDEVKTTDEASQSNEQDDNTNNSNTEEQMEAKNAKATKVANRVNTGWAGIILNLEAENDTLRANLEKAEERLEAVKHLEEVIHAQRKEIQELQAQPDRFEELITALEKSKERSENVINTEKRPYYYTDEVWNTIKELHNKNIWAVNLVLNKLPFYGAKAIAYGIDDLAGKMSSIEACNRSISKSLQTANERIQELEEQLASVQTAGGFDLNTIDVTPYLPKVEAPKVQHKDDTKYIGVLNYCIQGANATTQIPPITGCTLEGVEQALQVEAGKAIEQGASGLFATISKRKVHTKDRYIYELTKAYIIGADLSTNEDEGAVSFATGIYKTKSRLFCTKATAEAWSNAKDEESTTDESLVV